MKRFFYFFFALIVLPSCSRDNGTSSNDPGHRMLLIGNSFFKPYANHLDDVAADAGYRNHNSTLVFRGGENDGQSAFGMIPLAILTKKLRLLLIQVKLNTLG